MNDTHRSGKICYADVVSRDHVFEGKDSEILSGCVPQLVLQMALTLSINHGLLLFFQRFNQPRIVADIITAVIMSPATLDCIHDKLYLIAWPDFSLALVETFANLGLLYAMFIQGLHTDLTPIHRKTTKTIALACSMVTLPFAVGCALYLLFYVFVKGEKHQPHIEVVTIYWGTVVAATSFPTLAPILAKLKLLCTGSGKEALFLGMMNDVFGWFLIIFILSISATSSSQSSVNNYHHHILEPNTALVLFLMVAFIIFCVLGIRPAISWIVGKAPEGENYSDNATQMIILLALACGLLMDSIGSHFVFGAFVLGMCVPYGVLASTLIEKMEDFVLGVLLPLYFGFISTKMDVPTLFKDANCIWVIVLGASAKAFCTLITSCVFNVPNGLALGVLLSAKGLLPLVIIHIGLERGHLTRESFTCLALIILLSTVVVTPIMSLCYRKMRKTDIFYEQRTIEGANPTEELRLIVCIHNPRNVTSMINLLEMTNITTEAPVSVSVLHLVELVGHASAMLIEHLSRDTTTSSSGGIVKPFFTRMRSQSDNILNAFQDYEEQHSVTSFVENLTIVSPIETMHEDICSLAEDKQATLVIISFHKQQGADGNLEDTNIEFRGINQNVMASSPCSVGLLVDRGLSVNLLSPSSPMAGQDEENRQDTRIAMVFIGGPDDREALTYAWRMAGHPYVVLTVIRFLVGENAVDIQPTDYPGAGDGDDDEGILAILTQTEKEEQIDHQFIQTFRQRTVDDDSIEYLEQVSNSGEETINMLREIHQDYDLYVVGRGRSMFSPLTAGLAEWSDCPELGPMGDVLITSDFTTNSSVLIIQQHSGGVKNNQDDDKYSDDEGLIRSYQEP